MNILKVKQNGNWVDIPALVGPPGEGVPSGGTAGHVLKKKTGTNYDTEWSTETVSDVQINGNSIVSNGTANIPYASSSGPGVVNILSDNGIGIRTGGVLTISSASAEMIKAGTNTRKPIVPNNQDGASFYGLAKAAGDSTQASSNNAVGAYTDNAKAAIQHMLGTDTNLADYESDTTADQAYAIGELFMLNGKLHQATAAIASGETFTVGTNCVIVNAADVFPHDVQVNGTSVVSNGVANVPLGTQSSVGVVQADNTYGITINSGKLNIYRAQDNQVKAGSEGYRPIVPSTQHRSAFYGLAKAAGDSTQSASNNAVGTYTETAKSKISDMLNAPEIISGTTPTINAMSGVQYICGEVLSLTLNVPAEGIIDIVFESGSTPTLLTITSAKTGVTAIKWSGAFDDTSLDANTTYEINIMNGEYGVVGKWT